MLTVETKVAQGVLHLRPIRPRLLAIFLSLSQSHALTLWHTCIPAAASSCRCRRRRRRRCLRARSLGGRFPHFASVLVDVDPCRRRPKVEADIGKA